MTTCPKCGTTLGVSVAASILGERGKGVKRPKSGNHNKWLTCPYCPDDARKWQNSLKLQAHVSQCHPNGE